MAMAYETSISKTIMAFYGLSGARGGQKKRLKGSVPIIGSLNDVQNHSKATYAEGTTLS